jgi:hypothetical protein
MLTEEQIKKALHADRVVPVNVANPHGPLGLEHLAASVALLRRSQAGAMERLVALPAETWQRLDDLAREASQSRPQPVTASDVAAVILEQAVTGR